MGKWEVKEQSRYLVKRVSNTTESEPVNFKSKIKMDDRGPISLWLGDSQVWMNTAVEKDKSSGRGQSGSEVDSNELNVAHVCVGLAFELVLKALAKSEGRTIRTKHGSLKNYRALSKKSQYRIAQIVDKHTSNAIEDFLQYLDERMCHPDRKYWMVGRKGEVGGVGFVQNVQGLVIPDIAKVHAGIARMVGENTFEGWQAGMKAKVGCGPLIAAGKFDEDGVLRLEVSEFSRKMGVTTVPPQQRNINVLCPRCHSGEWLKEKQVPEPDDQVTCKRCQATMRAEDVIAWNRDRAGQ